MHSGHVNVAPAILVQEIQPMGYRSTRQCIEDLRKNGHLIELSEPVDTRLQMAEIQRRVFASDGPAILFSKPVFDGKPVKFPMVSNLFGTVERARFMFRDTIESVRRAIELKIDPSLAAQKPWRYWKAPLTALAMRPKLVSRSAVSKNSTRIGDLPQLISWPRDAGGFVTLPQVYSHDVASAGLKGSNLGMYRVQLTGNQYRTDRDIGLHYQIHRSIGVHHQKAVAAGQPFHVNIFVGGSPAMTLAAVMPLPEGMSELTFAGALAGHRIPMQRNREHIPFYADADFVISGTVKPDLMPEGPFGDHLGYYSLEHMFPALEVEHVWHRDDAIWPFTVVGRPPQEDTIFGELIHELTGPIIPTVLPGVKGVHAVDASGVHPLLLAIGSERYVPWKETTAPQELLTQANAILGQGQLSLAKVLMIIDQAAVPELDIHDIHSFFQHVLQRVNWCRDLHFQTRTTIDTLDYSGSGFNEGSKVVIAAAGPAIRQIADRVPTSLRLPDGFDRPTVCMAGVLAIRGPQFDGADQQSDWFVALDQALGKSLSADAFPLVVVVDDPEFCARHLNNFLWVVFTRSNPAADFRGVDASIVDKHWGCRGSLVIDARIKPHHAPPLVEDPETTAFVDALASRGGELAKFL